MQSIANTYSNVSILDTKNTPLLLKRDDARSMLNIALMYSNVSILDTKYNSNLLKCVNS